MKRMAGLSIKIVAVFAILSFFTSGCTLIEDILRALGRTCATTDWTVTTEVDIPDAGLLCATTNCTLRQAIETSNACPGVQTIHIPAGTYTLTRTGAGEDNNRTGDLDIKDSVNILGEGNPGIDGNHTDRVFDIFPGATVDMTGLTIQHGQSDDGGGIRSKGILRLHNMTLQENVATTPVDPTTGPTGGGGGILSERDGTLTMDGSQVIGNSAYQGGGVAAYPNATTSLPPSLVEIRDTVIAENSAASAGGGLFLYVTVRVNLTNVEIRDNSAGSDNGDGIWNGAILGLTQVTISGNHGGINGGGIYNEPAGNLSAWQVLLQNNTARFGGGIYNAGLARFFQSAIVENTAERGQGGGVYNADTESALTINNTTISGNNGPLGGGAIRNDNGNFQVVFSTLAANSPDGINGSGSGEMTMRDSILTEHPGGNCTGISTVSNGFNIEDANTCSFVEPSDLVSTDPLLMPLVSEGGTYVHPLDLGSPALDSADPDRCDGTDQRGVTRPQGAGCDRGAFELEGGVPAPTATPLPTPTVVATATPVPTATPAGVPLVATAGLSFTQPGLSVDHFYSGGAGCGPLDLKLQVQVSEPNRVSSVVLFFHLKDKSGGGSTPWNDGVVMEPQGSGVYSYDLLSKTIPAFNSYPEAWLVYQFAATGAGGQVLLRSPAYSDITLIMCGKK